MIAQMTEGQRVRRHTREHINQSIDDEINRSIAWHADHPEHIDARLAELDDEWDVERALEANAATLALTGTVLGMTVDRKWHALPLVVTAFLLQHAVQGWCPPLPVMRQLGVRTRGEIDREKYALKMLRGDFDDVTGATARTPEGRHAMQASLQR
jgi:hypothetical protein